MTVDLSLPVWSLPIDWTDGVTETLEFLTTVGESPSAIEQRRGLRLTPRQYFEYQYILKGPERTYFDLLTMRAGGSPCYLPIWHDVEVLAFEHTAGMTALGINVTYTEFMNCDAVMLGGTHDYELVEILGRADTVVTLTTALINTWPAGTRVVPLKKVKLDQQPSTTRKTESIHVARVKFCSIEPNRTDAEPPLNTFGLQYVLETDPNEVDDLTYNYERVLSTLDNTTGLPTLSDVTGRVLQQFAWWCKGRQAHHQLRGLFYSLDGRRVPVWVPTIYADFEPVTPIGAGDLVINVKRNGFTNLGGPQPQREYILIHLHDGTRYYRKITNSVILSDKVERIFIDAALGADVSLVALNRISFLVLCRLDQDAVEMIHHTATRGMTTVVAVFRSAAAKDGIENIFEVPPSTMPSPICLNDFQWYQGSPSIAALRYFPSAIDQYGNFYDPTGNGVGIDIYNPNGVLLQHYTGDRIADGIDAWYGSAIFHRFPSYYTMWAQPIRQGKYVLVYTRTVTYGYAYDHWWALCEPALDGSLTVKGAYFTRILLGPPYLNGIHPLEITDDDQVILFLAYTFLGSYTAVMGVLPSINQFLDGTYKAGWPGPVFGGPVPCQVPETILAPIGTNNLSLYLYTNPPGTMSHVFGFRLPGNGRELLYIYISRAYMESTTTHVTSLVCPEIKNVIAPLYPFGAILKVPLGDISDLAEIASIEHTGGGAYRGRATEMYTVDNLSWQDEESGPAIPFLDEFTYISDNTVGGADCYTPAVSTALRTNGKHWVVFVMPGMDDSAHRRPETVFMRWQTPVYARVKLFEYNPATEIATLFGEHVCVLHTNEFMPNIGPGSAEVFANDYYIFSSVTEITGAVIVTLHGRLFKSDFCKFFIPEEE